MILPRAITTLTELHQWVVMEKPDSITIIEGSPITRIKEFNRFDKSSTGHKRWTVFDGLKINYVKL